MVSLRALVDHTLLDGGDLSRKEQHKQEAPSCQNSFLHSKPFPIKPNIHHVSQRDRVSKRIRDLFPLSPTMDNIGDEYKHYWETNMFLQTEELDSWGLDEAFSGYYDSSSPDGAASSAASKNIVSERNRRKKLNERLFALRAVVPNISKMDKASIIKDAIEYIQELHDQERRIKAEISELELGNSKKNIVFDNFEHELPVLTRSKKKRTEQCFDLGGSRISPIEVLELRVSYMGEKTVVVSLTCSKRTDTMVRLCEVFESLKLKIITANITAFSGRLLKTVFVEADEEEKDDLQIKIKTAIEALSDPLSPMSI